MSDNSKEYAGTVTWPNMRSEAEFGMRKIFRMGLMHAAFELRGTDFDGIPDEHVDRLAEYIEAMAYGDAAPTDWPLPDDWAMGRGRVLPKHGSGP